MKRTFVVVLITIMFTSCHLSSKKPGLNLVKGEVYKQWLLYNMSVDQTINGQQINTVMIVGSIINFKVMEIQDSVYDVECNYERLMMNGTLLNGAIKFDSKNYGIGSFSAFLNAIIKEPFYVKISRSGKIIEIRNLESLFAGSFKKSSQLTDAQKKQLLDQLIHVCGEKAFKDNFEMSQAIFPDDTVNIGQTWVNKLSLNSWITGDLETTYQLREKNDSIIMILGHSKITTTNLDAYLINDGRAKKYNLEGTLSSQIKIDSKSGWVLRASFDQNIQGTAQVNNKSDTTNDTIIPVTMNSILTLNY